MWISQFQVISLHPCLYHTEGNGCSRAGCFQTLRDLPDSGSPGLGLRQGTTTPCQFLLITYRATPPACLALFFSEAS